MSDAVIARSSSAGWGSRSGPSDPRSEKPLVQEFGVNVKAALCFVDAEWSLFAKPLTLDGVWVGWAKALGERLLAEGPLEGPHLITLARRVATALPPA